MKKTREENIPEKERLQECLLPIRRILGWTSEELGLYVGLSRQAINNIEKKTTVITKTQYIAIRSILDAELATSEKDTQVLGLLLEVFVDNPEKYNNEYKKEIMDKVNLISPSIQAKTVTREKATTEILAMLSIGATAAITAGVITVLTDKKLAKQTGAWLIKSLMNDRL